MVKGDDVIKRILLGCRSNPFHAKSCKLNGLQWRFEGRKEAASEILLIAANLDIHKWKQSHIIRV